MTSPVAAPAGDVLRPGRRPQVVELRHGRYRAGVTTVGAALTYLTFDDRPLVLDSRADIDAGRVPMPLYTGAVLAPWPNRIRNGHYSFDGVDHQLPVNEVGRGCALHGLLLWQHWHVVEHAHNTIALGALVYPQPGYPFTVEVTVGYRLGDAGLTVELAATNLGDRTAPVGLSVHPYVVPGDTGTPMDEWTLRVPMATVLEVDADRLLPRRMRDVGGSRFDFRTARALAGVDLDHAFTDATGRSATVTGPDGFAVAVTWDDACSWLQVCTIDAEKPQWRRAGVAIEPMTCAPDAFNSGLGLWSLEPMQHRRATLGICTEPS